MTTAVVWFEIYVDDMARAKRFYEQLFGVTLNKLTHDNMHEGMDYWAFPGGDQNTYGSNGALVKMLGLKAGGGCQHCLFPY